MKHDPTVDEEFKDAIIPQMESWSRYGMYHIIISPFCSGQVQFCLSPDNFLLTNGLKFPDTTQLGVIKLESNDSREKYYFRYTYPKDILVYVGSQ